MYALPGHHWSPFKFRRVTLDLRASEKIRRNEIEAD